MSAIPNGEKQTAETNSNNVSQREKALKIENDNLRIEKEVLNSRIKYYDDFIERLFKEFEANSMEAIAISRTLRVEYNNRFS